MRLERLLVQNVRSISSVDLTLSAHINVIYGDNGEGKTSLLEAIHMLSIGRSFRTRLFNAVVRHHESYLSVGGICRDEQNSRYQLGVKLSKEGLQSKINGESCRGISQLSALFPVVCFTPETASSLVQKSSFRRSFMDWGCFQDNPTYLHHWKAYNRVLKQRNAAIRIKQSRSAISIWDSELARTGAVLNSLRKDYVSRCKDLLEIVLKQMDIPFGLSVTFKSGWGSDDFKSDLSNNFERDLKRGFTQIGAHRDDLLIKISGRAISNEGSRGQIKMSSLALVLLQTKLASSVKSPVLLLDDLPSEFDDNYLSRALELIEGLGVQTFLTSVSPQMSHKFPASETAVFHVKQGEVFPEAATNCFT